MISDHIPGIKRQAGDGPFPPIPTATVQMPEPAPQRHTMPPPLEYAPKKSALDQQVAGAHYKNMKIQPIEYIHANSIGFAEGCVIKYVTRWRAKGGIKDLEKAKHFLDLLIELETRK